MILLPLLTHAQHNNSKLPTSIRTDGENGFYYYNGTVWIPIYGKLYAQALLGYIPSSHFSCLGVSGSLGIGRAPSSAIVSGNYAYIVDQASDVRKVIDVSNPTKLTLGGSFRF